MQYYSSDAIKFSEFCPYWL